MENDNRMDNLKKAYNGRGYFDTESARKAKVKSDEAKREKKKLRMYLEELLSKKIKDADGMEITRAEKICISLIEEAMDGDVKAFAMIRDTIGEKPLDRIDLTSKIKEDSMSKLREAIARRREKMTNIEE